MLSSQSPLTVTIAWPFWKDWHHFWQDPGSVTQLSLTPDSLPRPLRQLLVLSTNDEYRFILLSSLSSLLNTLMNTADDPPGPPIILLSGQGEGQLWKPRAVLTHSCSSRFWGILLSPILKHLWVMRCEQIPETGNHRPEHTVLYPAPWTRLQRLTYWRGKVKDNHLENTDFMNVWVIVRTPF